MPNPRPAPPGRKPRRRLAPPLLGLGRAYVAFGLVVGGRHAQVVGEAGDVVEPVAQCFEQAVEVCGEEAEQFLVEGPDIVPSMVPRLSAALPGITIRSCFLGSVGFSADDLASYRGPKPQHEGAPHAELDATAAWIRQESDRYRRECTRLGLPYVDVGDLGFEAAMTEARRDLLGRRAAI